MSAEYWASTEGLTQRGKMLSHHAIYMLYNKILNGYAKAVDAEGMRYHGFLDEKTCEICTPYIKKARAGFFYRRWLFKPKIPQHVWCRDWWELVYGGVPQYVI